MAELLMSPIGKRLDLQFVSQVGCHRPSVYTLSLQLGDTLLDPRTAGSDQYTHAFAAQTSGDRQTNTTFTARTADQRDLTLPHGNRHLSSLFDHTI